MKRRQEAAEAAERERLEREAAEAAAAAAASAQDAVDRAASPEPQPQGECARAADYWHGTLENSPCFVDVRV